MGEYLNVLNWKCEQLWNSNIEIALQMDNGAKLLQNFHQCTVLGFVSVQKTVPLTFSHTQMCPHARHFSTNFSLCDKWECKLDTKGDKKKKETQLDYFFCSSTIGVLSCMWPPLRPCIYPSWPICKVLCASYPPGLNYLMSPVIWVEY